ncbi:MAG: sulfatase, partial [Chlamydiia bacterium]|nr:sulfatase [Chlamydiia bacterium]
LRPQLACYGSEEIKSPNIDNFANTSIVFSNAYANVPVCGASRASMLTGMYPTKNRYINYDTFAGKESPDAISFPLLFKQSGYTTISNGKVYHHLDDNMGDWDEVWRPYAFDKNDKGLVPTDYWQSLWRDYHLPENIELYSKTNKGPSTENADINDSTYIDGLMASKVIRDIRKLKNSDKPFLLTAGFISNHLPFNAPAKHWDKYSEEEIKQPKNNFIPANAPKEAIGTWGEMRQYTDIPRKGQVDDETALRLIHGYNATVSYVDVLIGNILSALKEEGLDKNTIVILVADHGYNLQEHTIWAKYNPFQDASRVPLIVHMPKMTEGTSSSSLIELVDIYPTLVELCGLIPPKNQLDGKSFVNIISNPTLENKDFVFTKTANAFTITTKQYSYTEFIDLESYKTISSMLYDHKVDSEENNNVVNEQKYTSVVTDLQEILHTNFKNNITGNIK